MLSFPPSNLHNSRCAVVENGECVGLHPATLSLNLGLLATLVYRRATRARRSTWARDRLDGISVPTSVALIFLAQGISSVERP